MTYNRILLMAFLALTTPLFNTQSYAGVANMEVTLEILPNVKEMPLTKAIEFCQNEPMVPACQDINTKISHDSDHNYSGNFDVAVEDGFASYQIIND